MLKHDDIKHKYVSYDIARDLCELGYKEPSSAYFIVDTLVIIGVDIDAYLHINSGNWYSNKGAPTYDEVIEWLMKEHGFYAFVEPKISWPDNYVSGCEWHNHIFCGNGKDYGDDGVRSKRESQRFIIERCIEILKEDKNEKA